MTVKVMQNRILKNLKMYTCQYQPSSFQSGTLAQHNFRLV